ncbi:MAG: AmmeMemoRadiSam system protein B [Planctomycetes bacterium]|nr:AmmeMemoRadiSam system protein B [Planctomycetota bacterium]
MAGDVMRRALILLAVVLVALISAGCGREEPRAPAGPGAGPAAPRPMPPDAASAPASDAGEPVDAPRSAVEAPAPSPGETAPTEPPARAPRPPARKQVLVSRLAGTWYPADRRALEEQISKHLEAAGGEKPLEDVLALILPHAGYRFSGRTAASGIRQVAGRALRRVIVMGPSHRMYLRNVASVPDATHYATPLGEVELDREAIEKLLESPHFQTIPPAHDEEHSVQIEIPLLQKALGTFRLVPIVVGHLAPDAIEPVASALATLLDDRTLVVASSDFTHYGSSFDYLPFTEDVEENLRALDMGAVDAIRAKDWKGFHDYCERTGATICGRNPVAILLALLPRDSSAHLLRYDTSGALTGDFRSSVSYASIAFCGAWKPRAPDGSSGSEGSSTPRGSGGPSSSAGSGGSSARAPLGQDEKQRLLRIARTVLERYFDRSLPSRIEDLGVEITDAMKCPSGVFVTLKKRGRLRGCIGSTYPVQPLHEGVVSSALSAALRDRRFPPVGAGELAEIELEISVLTTPRPVESRAAIEIGRHGIILSKDGHSALFLPQVATEQGWSLEETLSQLALKAGLAPDAWREGARLQVFEAIVFGEGGSAGSEKGS